MLAWQGVLDRQLLRKNLRLAPSQPATALWRAIEIGHLIQSKVLPREGRGLDLGCGDGRITGLLRDSLGAEWQLVGVDPDPDEVALAAASGVYEAVGCTEGSSIDAPTASFGFAFSNSVLEHVDELEPTLREVGRVLAPGAPFVFTVPSEFFPENLGAPGPLTRFVTRSRDTLEYRREIDTRLAHRRYLTLDEWRAALGRADLEVAGSSLYMSRHETRRWAALSNSTAGVLVRLSRQAESPLEIQRRLGVRGEVPPLWLRSLGRAIGELGALGLGREGSSERCSCLLVVARKMEGAA